MLQSQNGGQLMSNTNHRIISGLMVGHEYLLNIYLLANPANF
jgi:hypothetical protein